MSRGLNLQLLVAERNDRMPHFEKGVYPTMITPYTKDGSVDYTALRKMMHWYDENECTGVFAVCQSSELFQLTLQERVEILKVIVEEADNIAMSKMKKRMTIIASGHTSDDIAEQAEELIAMHESGAEAVIWISNRLDIENISDEAWISDACKLLELLPEDIPLGVYECPTPYKRLMSDDMLKWCRDTKRFYFMKDTSCNNNTIARRIQMLKDSSLNLYNANAQTFLESLKCGGSGYCGIMANFHPKLYVWLYRNFHVDPQKAELVGALLSIMSFTEALSYPLTAKYYLNTFENTAMEVTSRVRDDNSFSDYDALVMEQMKLLADHAEVLLGLDVSFI